MAKIGAAFMVWLVSIKHFQQNIFIHTLNNSIALGKQQTHCYWACEQSLTCETVNDNWWGAQDQAVYADLTFFIKNNDYPLLTMKLHMWKQEMIMQYTFENYK